MKDYPIVRAHTLQGRILIKIIRALLWCVYFVNHKKYEKAPPFFHDDPLHYSARDLLFFAYKYYLKPPEKSDAAHLDTEGGDIFFQQNPPTFPHDENDIEAEVCITASGDLMPYEWIQKPFCTHLWDDIEADFFDSDIVFGNLETPLDTTQAPALVPEVMLNDMLFNANAEMYDIFTNGNRFDILSTANNHSLDMGEKGVKNTIAFLREKNTLHTGTSRNTTERENAPIITRNGIPIAFLSYTFSINKFENSAEKPFLVNHLRVNMPDIDLRIIRRDVSMLRQRGAEFVVLSLHFGNAYQAYPGTHIVENAQRIFEKCGVDIILGGHPHNVQPMASYPFQCPFSGADKKGFVIFSFGDFVAYDIFTWCHLSVYLKIWVARSSKDGSIFIKKVVPTPVYACGKYEAADKRDLRFYDAKRLIEKVEKGEKTQLTSDNIAELQYLWQFYNRHFAKNIL